VSMKIKTRQVDGITIMDCSGRITLGEGSVQLRDAVRDLLSKGSKQILLNLGDVTYIDSSGIGELVSAFTTVRNQGGDLKLLNLTKKVHDLLQITKLYTVFDIKDDEASAIAAFKNHCSLFPMSYFVIDKFRAQLARFEVSKGTVRFPIDKPLPSSLLKKIVKARLTQMSEKQKNKSLR